MDQLKRHNKESDLHKARHLMLCTRILPGSFLTLFSLLFMFRPYIFSYIPDSTCGPTEEFQGCRFARNRFAEGGRIEHDVSTTTKIQGSRL